MLSLDELEELARKSTPGRRFVQSRTLGRTQSYVNGASIRTDAVIIARVTQPADKPPYPGCAGPLREREQEMRESLKAIEIAGS